MKNPFKAVGEKIKAIREGFSRPKAKPQPRRPTPEEQQQKKEGVDSMGDSLIIGGLAILGIAAFTPATVPALVTGAVFLTAGGTAKVVAAKMKGIGPELETALPPEPPAPKAGDTTGPQARPAGPDFAKAVKPAEGKGAPQEPSAKTPKPSPSP